MKPNTHKRKFLGSRKRVGTFALIIALLMVLPAGVGATEPVEPAVPTVPLGTTAEYSVLAGTTVTNTGSTTIDGSVGVSPGSAVTGFPPGIVGGTIHTNDAEAIQAQSDLTTAYNNAAGRSVTEDLTGKDLGGMTLKTGVYSFSSSAALTGTLTLDAEGDPNAAFIFQIGSTLTTASGSSIQLINGARFCRVFWQVTSSATLGTNSDFVGHIFALTSITAQSGATIDGQLLARNGAVTLDTNTFTSGACATVTVPDDTETDDTTTPDETETSDDASQEESSPKTGSMGDLPIVGWSLLGIVVGLALIRRRPRLH